ncbi:MAG TPA: hypothetical protein VHE37_15425 [Nevskiaceae bacterium]|nr:hypothetical protein [Nevskiaceae bacterium]
MEQGPLTTEQALELHRSFLKEVLAEMLQALSEGEPGIERVCRSLEVYWESAYARREARRAVLAATTGTAIESTVEPMGRPFQLMVEAELSAAHCADAHMLSQFVYQEARGIAVEEAMADARKPQRRRRLLERIRQG